MEKLYELHADSDFDLVVVDTPPTRNALDFLDAPRRLTRFLDHRLYRVLMAPTRGVMRGGERRRAGVHPHGVEGRRRRRVRRRHRVLPGLRGHGAGLQGAGRPRCSSCSPTRSTAVRARRLAQAGHGRGGPLLRRQAGRGRHPGAGPDRQPHAPPRSPTQLPEALRERAATLAGTDLGGLYGNLADFALVAAREEEHLAGLAEQVAPAPVVRVPFLRSDVHDLDGLAEIAVDLFARPDSRALGRRATVDAWRRRLDRHDRDRCPGGVGAASRLRCRRSDVGRGRRPPRRASR